MITRRFIFGYVNQNLDRNALQNCIQQIEALFKSNISIDFNQADFQSIQNNPGEFSLQTYLEELKKRKSTPGKLQLNFGETLFYSSVCSSTQIFLKKVFGSRTLNNRNLLQGCVAVCDQQENGKGRGQNLWTSPLGALMFTLYFELDYKYGEKLPLLQYIASLAVVRSVDMLVKQKAPEKSSEHLTNVLPKIKWPNDIYFGKEVKIGGILSESVAAQGKFSVFIGIGINLNNNEPTTCLNSILKQAFPTEHLKLGREELLSQILAEFEKLTGEILEDGFTGATKAEYLKHWLHTGQKVTLEQEQVEVIIESISSSSGALVAKDSSGKRYELYPDGNRLDFFQGLISKKFA
eukprot:snap_masked-scaffold_13-processed-gene-4.40-mRNA-1 protein AED:0.16 eAED:0.21 QI:0/-1/0/1/-1/1/1/0/349